MKYMNNSSVAEHHQQQWQKVADKDGEESNALLRGVALGEAKRHARSLFDIHSYSCERNLNRWDADPDKCDRSIHEMFLHIQL